MGAEMDWMEKRREAGGLLFLAALSLCGLMPGCGGNDEGEAGVKLRAVQIESPHELIGGPSARGKVGDFLIENEKVRFIISDKGQSWAGGVFGGSLLDADMQRWWPEHRYGNGFDSFAETFPLVNLVVANPAMPGRELGFGEDGLQLVAIPSGIEILSDGSDGEAVIRVTGRVGYMFETFKFLNKDFLLSFITEPIELLGFKLPVDQLLNMFLGVNVYALVNRLQLDFLFNNDYVLHAGDSYLTLRTTIVTSPPSEKMMAHCGEVKGCKLECDHGFAVKEAEYEIEGQTTPTPGKAMCPVCECAEEPEEMLLLNEGEDIFQIMLGDLEPWRDPAWKGGLLGGDFLFFGSQANIFSPGLGFDENQKIFENMWQKVPTLANPLTFDWLAAVADNVSYGWVTRNPDRRSGADCPSYRVAITALTYEQEAQTIDTLVGELGFSEDLAVSRIRHVIVDRRPFIIKEIPTSAAVDDFAAWADQQLAEAEYEVVDPDDPAKSEVVELAGLFPEGVQLSLIPATECLSSKVLIPIFTTSATAVMTHKSRSTLDVVDGTPVDKRRIYSFERYLVVGDGDVGSVLRTVYELKGEPYGTVSGAVFDEKTRAPVIHASVFALKDPRSDPGAQAYGSYAELVSANRETFGNDGFVSQMQSDRGLDLVEDGDYSGPLAPGSYFLVAFTKGRGVSKPVPVTVKADKTATAHLLIPSYGTVKYNVRNQQGLLLPSRVCFHALSDTGKPLKWDGRNHVELGGIRYDHGIQLCEHAHDGQGEVTLPAGRYEVYASRGFEYGLYHMPDLTVQAGQTVPVDAVLVHEVDTTGYISGDFHVHCQPSIDSSLPMETRIAANAAEGVEFITSTDHDILVNYEPWIHKMGMETFMKSSVGVETTTFEFGHYNGFPMEYDHTDIPVHDPAPWYGRTIPEVWAEMRARVQEGTDPADFIVQINHARDGFMGYLSQLGLKGYNLERATPGMEMCNPQTERISCDFDTMELMNEKRFELLRTPTIGEKEMHNVCFEEIMEVTQRDAFTGEDELEVLCAYLRVPPHDNSETIGDELKSTKAQGLELAELHAIKDHCKWHQTFTAEVSECTEEMPLVKCKKQALDALKLLTVRYMIERTPEEQAAFFATTAATDIGCDYKKAVLGTTETLDDKGELVGGCGGEDCACEICVCDAHPECCEDPDAKDPDAIGTGWTEACAQVCLDDCHGGPVRPCTSKQQIFDDWFNFLNHGFNKTAIGNSDSHNTKAEVGLPRNWVVSSTDEPGQIKPAEIFRNIKEFRTFLSTGPFVEFSINGAILGDTVAKPGGKTLQAHLRIQTPSWFGIDHIEIHRNAKLEQIIRLDPAPQEIVDFDQVIELPVPAEDSWYVIITYGLADEYLLSPVYKRMPLGKMLIPTIISLGAKSILISFQSVIREVEDQFGALLGGGSVEDMLGDFMGVEELPDSFPMFPLALTNPIWVDLDGKGWQPPAFQPDDQLDDGSWPLPSFCSQPCQAKQEADLNDELVVDGDGNPVWSRATCGENQTCVPDVQSSSDGTCIIPIPANCVGAQVAQE